MNAALLARRRMIATKQKLYELKVENLTEIKNKNATNYVEDVENGIRFVYTDRRDLWARLVIELKPNTSYELEFDVKCESNNTYNFALIWTNSISNGAYSSYSSLNISGNNGHVHGILKTKDTDEELRMYICGTRDMNNCTGTTTYTNFSIKEA